MKILSFLSISISLLLLAAMNTITVPHMMQIAGNISPLDLRLGGYTFSEVTELFERLGTEGRNYYVFPQLFLDLFYPLLFSIGYSIAIYKLNPCKNWLTKIGVSVCVLGGAFDLIENFCTWSGLRSFPALNPNLVQIGSFATLLKFSFSALGLLIFFVLVAKRLRLKNQS